MPNAPDGRALPVMSVSLWLGEGSFDPDDITAQIGLDPTVARRAGEIRSYGGRQRRDQWGLRVGPRDGIEIEPLLDELHGQLVPRWSRLVAACSEGDLEPRIYCPVELKSTLTPSLRIEAATLEWIVALGAVLDIDVMAWESE
jgi:Domain of unknown function (DUF4279)